MSLLASLPLLLLLLIPPSVAQCYFRDGSIAIISTESYGACPGSNFCCLPHDTCGDNGLCQDVNNHDNGSLTTFDGGATFYNFTGLYQTPACTNANWTGCQTQCSSSQSSSRAYIWSCNYQRTEYCCAGNDDLEKQQQCCSASTDFELSISSTTSLASTSTSTATSPSSATSSAVASTPPPTGLSQGAKIGIGVGVPVAVIVIAVLLAVWCLSRRKKSRRVAVPALPYAPHMAERPAMSAGEATEMKAPMQYSRKPFKHKSTVEERRLVEMDAGQRGPVEVVGDIEYLEQQQRRHELP